MKGGENKPVTIQPSVGLVIGWETWWANVSTAWREYWTVYIVSLYLDLEPTLS